MEVTALDVGTKFVEHVLKTTLDANMPGGEKVVPLPSGAGAQVMWERAQDGYAGEGEKLNHIPHLYTPHSIGMWAAEESIRDGLGYCFDATTREWFKAGETHWTRQEWEDVRGDLTKRYEDKLAEHALGMSLNAESDADKKDWRRNLNAVLARSLFQRNDFKDGFRGEVSIALEPPPAHLIATAGGIVDISTLSVEPFNPALHTHKSACPVKILPTDLDNDAPVVKAYADAFYDRFESEEMAIYCHWLLGRALVGMSHRAYMLLLAPRGAGKTTWTTTLQTALGNLAIALSENVFDQRGNHNDDKCNLVEYQSRFAFLPEAGGVRIQAATINELTGGGVISSRRPHARGRVEGYSIALPIMDAEHAPRIYGTTAETVERQKVVRFKSLGGEKQKASMLGAARDAASDIVKGAFAAVVIAAKYVLENPDKVVLEPKEVEDAGEDALQEQDPFAAYVNEHAAELAGITAKQIATKFIAHLAGPENDPVDIRMTAHAAGRALDRLNWRREKGKEVTTTGKRTTVVRWYQPEN